MLCSDSVKAVWTCTGHARMQFWVLPTMLKQAEMLHKHFFFKQAEIVSSFKQAEIVLMHAMYCRPGKRCSDVWQDLHDVGCETLQKYVNKAGQAASVNEQLQIDHTPAKAFA